MIKLTRALCLLSLLGLLTACDRPSPDYDLTPQTSTDLQLRSDAFEPNGEIPQVHTCDGEDVAPSLTWGEAPEDTQSYALIMDDPDAPRGTWVHWVVYNLPATQTELEADNLPSATNEGRNDFRKLGYGGPCPPKGEHRYFFKLYALDTMLELSSEATKAEVEAAMQGRILATGELVGRYTRSPK